MANDRQAHAAVSTTVAPAAASAGAGDIEVNPSAGAPDAHADHRVIAASFEPTPKQHRARRILARRHAWRALVRGRS